MNNINFSIEKPLNEKVLSYAPGSVERVRLGEELDRQSGIVVDIPAVIGGKEIRTGDLVDVVMPHDHRHVLARFHRAGAAEIESACSIAVAAQAEWMRMPWVERAVVFMKAAHLISDKYRYLLSAATMLGQSKNAYQAEIDAIAETVDFLRMNAAFASEIYASQPASGHDQMNRLQYRPLEGFVFAVTPFNFTAIAANLPTAPALMGNTVVWKPASAAVLPAYFIMKILEEAGMPPGVINMVPGPGPIVGPPALNDVRLGGIHFTGSTYVFSTIW
ncbi:MAG: aldehyde dehydrogenase family protein, partial [Candidatus Sabulitectum sp.]|nr:aldehyde dehydrogenase family protein [Candidatus Sabulitectum sp.]